MGARIADLRDASGLEQQTIADFCDVRLRTYQFWQEGKHTPSQDHVEQLAALFTKHTGRQITATYILRGDTPDPFAAARADGTGPDDGRLAALEDQISQNSEHIRQNTERLAQIEQQLEILLSRLPAKDERTAEIHRAFEDYASRLGREVGRRPPRSRQATDLSRKAPQAAA